MDANRAKKTYAAPTLASHGSVIAKTEAILAFPPLEDDATGTRSV
jgi:hypothetical protein